MSWTPTGTEPMEQQRRETEGEGGRERISVGHLQLSVGILSKICFVSIGKLQLPFCPPIVLRYY